jgi:hypothetical protein
MLQRWSVPLALALALAAAGCESEHEYFDVVVDAPDVSDDAGTADGEDAADGEDGDDAGPVTTFDCGFAGGVSAEGTVTFTGTPPGAARLYVSWVDSATAPSVPHCMLEIVPVAFPARFRFTNVERDAGWALGALLDADGGAIPYPATGDFVASITEGTIDLSADVTGLVLALEPYAD